MPLQQPQTQESLLPDDEDKSVEDIDGGDASSDSESRRMVLRSQSGKSQRKRRWTTDYHAEVEEDAFDDDDESGSYRGTSRRSRQGKLTAPRDPLPKRSSRIVNGSTLSSAEPGPSARAKGRGKRYADGEGFLQEQPPPKRTHTTKADDDESAIASLLGLADAADTSQEPTRTKAGASARAEQLPNRPRQSVPSTSNIVLSGGSAPVFHQPPSSLPHTFPFPMAGVLSRGVAPPNQAFDVKSIAPFPYGTSSFFNAAGGVMPPQTRPVPKPVKEELRPQRFSSLNSALAATDSALAALSSTKRCAAHMAIAYAIHYKQKKQELLTVANSDASTVARFLTQFSLDPTFVARALKEKSESQRSSPPQPPSSIPAAVGQQPSVGFSAAAFPPKVAGYTGLMLPGGEVPSDLQTLQMQLQLAQQYQALHSNPALVQQLTLQAMLPSYLMGRPPPGSAAAMVAPLAPPPPQHVAVSPTVTTGSAADDQSRATADPVEPAHIQPESEAASPSEPTRSDTSNVTLTDCVAHDTKELAVRSFGALLTGISASEPGTGGTSVLS